MLRGGLNGYTLEVFYVFAELLENLICNNGFHDIKSYNQDNILGF